VASHSRIPGLVTQDRPRAVKEPCRGHRRGRPSPRPPRRPVHLHGYGADAGVSGTVRRKPARSLRSRHRFLLRHSLCKADPASGRVSLAGQRTDRPGNDVPGTEPSPAQARTGYGCPIPRDEPAEPLSEPCAPIANATGCPACISMHCSRVRKCALMPRVALQIVGEMPRAGRSACLGLTGRARVPAQHGAPVSRKGRRLSRRDA
jgi:hypothetical protein